MKIAATFVLTVIALAALAVVSTFFHRSKYEEFTHTTVQIPGGELQIFVRGTYSFSAVTLTTEYAGPYLLVAAFETRERFDQPIDFEILEFRAESGQNLASDWTAQETLSVEKDSSGLYRAAFLAENLKLEQEPVRVSGIVRVRGHPHGFNVILSPKTRVEWRNIWLDMLMSV